MAPVTPWIALLATLIVPVAAGLWLLWQGAPFQIVHFAVTAVQIAGVTGLVAALLARPYWQRLRTRLHIP